MWKVDKGTVSGTTAAEYADALDWKVEELREKTVLLKNVDSVNSLKYKLIAYASPEGIAGEEISETVLEAGCIAKAQLAKQWARLVIQVTSGSGSAAYRIDYIGQGA